MRKPPNSLNKSIIKLSTIALLTVVSAFFTTGIYAQKIKPVSTKGKSVSWDPTQRIESAALEPSEDAANRAPVPSDGNDLVTAATYPFTATSGVPLDDMSTGTTQLVAASLDDTASTVNNIGFEFYYDGVRYTQFSANANGLVRLGATVVTTSFDNTTFNSTTNAPKIAPYFEDLCTGSNGKVHYKVTGTAPNRKLVVEFLNMQVTRGTGCAGAGNGTFQMWIYESAGTTKPGVIQFVYGAMQVPNVAADGGYSIGLQSGAATNFASVTTSDNSVSYATANNANGTAIAAGTSYIFTPNVPAAPSGLTFTGTTQTSTTLNWTDNSSNELGFFVYRSNDGGANYTLLTQTAANVTTYADSGLIPGANYLYRVIAFSEGAFSTTLSGNLTTVAPGAVSCVGAGGNWSSTATWSGGALPTSTDSVTIGSGCTVTVDITTATAFDVTINSGGVLQSPTSGAVLTNNLTVNGNLTNNGTLDLSTNGNTSAAILTFAGASNNTFSGTGATTDVGTITVNKGTSTANVIELTAPNFTVQGSTTDTAGFLTLTNGTFKISGTFTMTNRVFPAAAYTVPATAGLWLNNPNFTVAGQAGVGTFSGLLRMTLGTYNIGTAADNALNLGTGANVTVEGGAINSTGRFSVSAAANVISYTQTGGTVTVNTVGSTSATLGSFDLGTSVTSAINISGGSIVVQLAATTIDYRNQAGTGITGVTGGTLQLGNAASGAAKSFNIRGVVGNLVISNASAGHTATWSTTLANYNNISRNLTINPGTTLNLGNVVFLFYGTTITNNGTLTHNGTSSNTVIFTDYAPVTYTGTGVVTTPLTALAFQPTFSFTIDPASPNIVTLAARLFSGNIINSNKVTVGNGGATSAVVQIGNTTTPTAAGTFDQPLTFNAGTGGITVSYLRTTNARSTGGELPPSRTITTFTYDDNDTTHSLTLAGGDLTVTGTSTLTNGRIVTGNNNFIVGTAGTVTRTAGLIDGNLNKTYTAAGSKVFEVGTVTGYTPTTINVTAGTFPAPVTAKAVGTTLQGLNSSQAVNRFWRLTGGAGLTADLSFTYLAADVNGTESTYTVYKREAGVTTLVTPSSVNTTTHVATAPGVTGFSDWGVGNALGVTAAQVTIEGRVLLGNKGIANARLTIKDSTGGSHSVVTNALGNYRFENIDAGSTYVISVFAKGYTFRQSVQALTVNDSLTGVNFTALAKSGTD